MPEDKQIRISSTFLLMCKQEMKYNISDDYALEKY